jgi:uncharacterized protein YciI
MSTFVFRLKAPRPTFALDMTDEEREIMALHAAYWQPMVGSGRMVIFGPVLDGGGPWGLGGVEADDEEEIRAFAGGEPVVTSGAADSNQRACLPSVEDTSTNAGSPTKLVPALARSLRMTKTAMKTMKHIAVST